MKEKQELMHLYEKIKRELQNEKERIKCIEQDRKRLEFEVQDLKEMTKFERRFGGDSISIINNKFNTSEIIKENTMINNNLLDIDKDSFIGELTGKATGERARNYEKEVIGE